MLKVLTFHHQPGAVQLTVSRGDAVPDLVWSRVQAEWASTGRNPATAVTVPVNVFLNRLDWVAPICRQHGVRVEWAGDAMTLVTARIKDRRDLEASLALNLATDGESARLALTGSRFTRNLRDFQYRDLAKLLTLRHGANFSVPGAGKTTVSLAVYEVERRRGRLEQLLVVAPISAFESWEAEIQASLSPVPRSVRFTGSISGGPEILLVNYQRLESGFGQLAHWSASRSTHMILDEAHRMKRGWSGEWGKNCLNLAHLAVRRDILTGTPAPQSVSDLNALFDFVWPGSARRIVQGDSGVLSPDVAATAHRIIPLFVRANKTELDLPDPLIHIIEKPLDPLHQEIYDAIRGRFGSRLSSSRSRLDLRVFARVVMYMLEAATNPALLVAGASPFDPIPFRHPPLDLPSDSGLDDLLTSYADFETPWKFRYLRLAVEDNIRRGRKTLIWSNFVRNLETLHRHELVDFGPAIVHGGVSDRDVQLRRFRGDNDCHVLLANPAALSEGISLHHACHDAMYLERTFNAGQYLQSLDRIHRLGLAPTEETRVSILSSAGTIDSLVEERIRQKTNRLSILMSDPGLSIMALPAPAEEGLEGEFDLGIDDSDLSEVIRHLAG